jgi:hypothetical protein
MAMPGIGAFVERLTIEHNQPDPIAVTTLTRASTLATVTTAVAHGYVNGDFVTIAGATPTGYNGTWKISVTAPTTFTYAGVNSSLTTPGTGTITALYVSDAQGGQAAGWKPFLAAPLPAQLLPIRAAEWLQQPAIESATMLRFRVPRRLDLTPAMRAQWTPQWPPGGAAQTLAITGILPDGDGRVYMFLDCSTSH